VAALRARSCLIDGEAIAYDDDGLASFELLRGCRHDRVVALCAFDLLEIDGRNFCRTPIEERKHVLARLNSLWLEGIVSKRLGSRYCSGRSPDWLKMKNPAAPAVRREAEEEWGR
jgi:bifunctional non-homologous end joining protein LigD